MLLNQTSKTCWLLHPCQLREIRKPRGSESQPPPIWARCYSAKEILPPRAFATTKQFNSRVAIVELTWSGPRKPAWAEHFGNCLDVRPQLVCEQREIFARLMHSAQTQETAAKLQADAQAAYRDALAAIEAVIEGSVRGHEARTTFLSTTSQVFEEAAALNAEMALASKGTDPTAASSYDSPLKAFASRNRAERVRYLTCWLTATQ